MTRTATRADRHAGMLVAHLPLVDGLRVCLSLVDQPHAFELAAMRWHARFVDHAGRIGLSEAQGALAALAGLRGARRRAAGAKLRELCLRHDQDEAAEVLDRWLRHHAVSHAGGPTVAARRLATTRLMLHGVDPVAGSTAGRAGPGISRGFDSAAGSGAANDAGAGTSRGRSPGRRAARR